MGIDDEHNYLMITSLLNEPTMRTFTATVEDVRAPARPDTPGSTGRPLAARHRVGRSPGHPADPEPNWRDPRQVFLTGATGFFGAHLLRELIDRTDARIHALVRAATRHTPTTRLAEAQRRYGIHRPLPEHRVRPILGDLTKPGLGMRQADWEREADGADVIHHCGAEVNFLYPYEKLRAANVYGTQEVLRLAARRAIRRAPRVHRVRGARHGRGGCPAGHRGHPAGQRRAARHGLLGKQVGRRGSGARRGRQPACRW